MNDLGTLATQIADYGYLADSGSFPVSYISGWLDANIGQFNAVTNEAVSVNSTGAFSPSLNTTEESIFTTLFEIHYYNSASRTALRNLTYTSSVNADWVSIKEGDSSIQRVNKNSVSRSFLDFSKDARSRLDEMVLKYLMGKASPIQVAGDDGLAVLLAD